MKDYFKKIIGLVAEKKWTGKFLEGQGSCIICGHDDPLDLEYHHVAGRKNGPVVVSLCRNCHGKITRKQELSWPKGWSDDDNCPKCKDALMMRGLSDILRLKSDHFLYGNTHE